MYTCPFQSCYTALEEYGGSCSRVTQPSSGRFWDEKPEHGVISEGRSGPRLILAEIPTEHSFPASETQVIHPEDKGSCKFLRTGNLPFNRKQWKNSE